ncbi:hypothetical protein [Coprococcus catus]|uniref:hypothetical protein n=1 Tax=Coprococcus catus TaxID=116085 RepID=UPI002A7B3829|nr:hypothetical protein [bacterium]MDY2884797.1 hypothetical protein [Bariatricus sp.]
MESNNEIIKLIEEFKSCQNVLIALGDETRQHLMLEMMKMKPEKDFGSAAGQHRLHYNNTGWRT